MPLVQHVQLYTPTNAGTSATIYMYCTQCVENIQKSALYVFLRTLKQLIMLIVWMDLVMTRTLLCFEATGGQTFSHLTARDGVCMV